MKLNSIYKKGLSLEIIVSIIVAIILRHIGDPEFLWEEIYSWEYILRLVSIVVDVLVLWETIKYSSNYLDLKLSWDTNIKKRIFVQYGLITFLSLITVSISEYFFRYLLGGEHLDIYFLTLHLPVLAIISFLISLYYTTIFFIETPKTEDRTSSFISNVSYTKGFSTFNIAIEHVAYFYYSNRVVFVVTINGDVGSVNFSLENLSKKVNPKIFIKINRQFILSKKSITKYNEIESRKLEVFVSPAPPENVKIIVSSKKSASLKKWIKEI